jgi:predicted ribonuclease YlaK
VVLDTNVLLDLPDLRQYRTDYPDLTLVILPEVLGELHGLGRSRGPEGQPARRAQLELDHLARMRGAALGVPVGGGTVSVLVPEPHGVKDLSVDAALIRTVQELQRKQPRAVVALFTRDSRVAEKALFAGIPCPLPRNRPVNARSAEEALRQVVLSASSY